MRPTTSVPSCLSGAVEIRRVCEFEDECNSIVHASIFNIAYQSSKCNAMVHVSTFDSSDVFVSLDLLYKENRHCIWYRASCAIRSPALNLAISRLSCNLRGTLSDMDINSECWCFAQGPSSWCRFATEEACFNVSTCLSQTLTGELLRGICSIFYRSLPLLCAV